MKLLSLLFSLFYFLHSYSYYSANINFKYFMLAETWPKSFCKQKQCIPNVPLQFSVHGLWPKNNTPPHTYKCTTDTNMVDLNNAKLKKVWPSLTGNNKGFWDHEWNQHGTCSTMLSVDYFNHAIILYEKNNIKDILKMPLNPGGAAALIPGGTAKSADIQKHIKVIIGFEPQLHCEKGSADLMEVRLCFNTDLVNPSYMNCPSHLVCPPDINLPL
ncbi:ribonuclease 1-like [Vicia villosa]|uniref:ribonuclease 1-like n=1 Tax=Vicia villosa TaxID=3911 RepID=UPI00273C5E4F|nr:ribonuclease 1-like [Vicia villosa]XP_058734978.1 ribonuclease 1-like [Vicia villosa]XP_058734982.1 ribonuclease 1-like [Vicia villosa]XP_058734983.1 ribonuclease 1-like [Vicia villosa]